MRVVLIDHYDSFTFNVIDWLRGRDGQVEITYVAKDDEAGLKALLAKPCPVILSPGPKAPIDAPLSLRVARQLLGRVPILGICLGHQMLAHLSGAQIVESRVPFHGATKHIRVLDRAGLFAGMPPEFAAASYNSLVVDPQSLGPGWRVTAVCGDSEVQGVRMFADDLPPAEGVQFHPESFMSQHADQLRANWLRTTQAWCP